MGNVPFILNGTKQLVLLDECSVFVDECPVSPHEMLYPGLSSSAATFQENYQIYQFLSGKDLAKTGWHEADLARRHRFYFGQIESEVRR